MTASRERAVAGYRGRYGRSPEIVARAPGRVNLLGEHVDYNEGLVLPAAIDRAAWLAAGRSGDGTVEVTAADLRETARFPVVAPELAALPAWGRYPAAVARAFAEAALPVTGLRAVLASDVPVGAGLSSSAAVELVFATSWNALGDCGIDAVDLARLCRHAENRHVGVACGLMDQLASACGRAGSALLVDCRSAEVRAVPLPASVAIVIADTGVRRSLAASDYNRRRAECEEAARLLGVRALRDLSAADLDREEWRLSHPLRRRARHVVAEIARVVAAVPALEGGDLAAFGRAMYESHASLRDLYEVSVPEADAMVERARAIDGCHGSRLTGAGFGGCTASLVSRERATEFAGRLGAACRRHNGQPAETWICQAAAGAGLD